MSGFIRAKNPRNWKKERDKPFKELKEKMCSVEGLQVSFHGEPFVFISNSCNYGCGGSLSTFQPMSELQRGRSYWHVQSL